MGRRSQIVLAMLFPVLLQSQGASQCPMGFVDTGEVSATASAGRYREVNVTKDLLLPKDIRLDDSYRQKSIQAASDGGASEMRAVQIPAGLHLIPGGRGGGAWWSIANPRLEAVSLEAVSKDERGVVVQWKFAIDLFANTGGRTSPPPARGGAAPVSDVRVRVCARPRQ
jgi:hypothetical protein